MLVMLLDGRPAGSIGFWARDWQGEAVWETGWSVLPEAQGRGVAKAGVAALLARLKEVPGPRFVHAFPGARNAPSKELCRSLGFRLLGELPFEYPSGQFMRCHDWAYELNPPT